MVAAGIQKLCGLTGALGKEGVGGEGQTGPPPALQPEKLLRITSQQEEERPERSPESRTMWAPHQPENCKAATGFNKGGHCVCVWTSAMVREKTPGWEAHSDGGCQQRLRKNRIHISTNSKWTVLTQAREEEERKPPQTTKTQLESIENVAFKNQSIVSRMCIADALIQHTLSFKENIKV